MREKRDPSKPSAGADVTSGNILSRLVSLLARAAARADVLRFKRPELPSKPNEGEPRHDHKE